MNLDGLIYVLIPYFYFKEIISLRGLFLVFQSYGGLRFLFGFTDFATRILFQPLFSLPAFNEYFLFPDQEIPQSIDHYANLRSGYKDMDEMFQSLLPKAKVKISEGMNFPLSGSVILHIYCFISNSSIPIHFKDNSVLQVIFRLLDSFLMGIPFRLLNTYHGILGNSFLDSMELKDFLSASTFIKLSSLENTYRYVGAINLEEEGEVPEFTPFSYLYLILSVSSVALILTLTIFLRGVFSSGRGRR